MAKILLECDYAYEYKRIGKLAYWILTSQVILPDHSGLYTIINFILGVDP